MQARGLVFICLVVFSLPLFADALPPVNIEAKWLRCQGDNDCDIVRDACRSCGKPIALNKTYIKDYLKLDYTQRKVANVMITCEACSQQAVRVICEQQQCKSTTESLPLQ